MVTIYGGMNRKEEVEQRGIKGNKSKLHGTCVWKCNERMTLCVKIIRKVLSVESQVTTRS